VRYPRVLFYTVNGLGLGHVTRLLAIARKLRGLLPDAEILFFTSSEAEDVVFREGFAAVKVPSKTLRARASIRPTTYARLLHTVTLNVIAAFHPHVLVVDTFPAGAMQELLPVLRWDCRKVFIYRVQRPEVAQSTLMQSSLALYDRIVVPHVSGEVSIPMPEQADAVWTGPILIRDRTEAMTREAARELLGLPKSGHVLYIAFGGGGDPAMDAALERTVQALHDCGTLLAVARAPLHRGEIPRLEHVVPVVHYPMAEALPAFDAAISAAGYNSAMELMHFGIPCALVPFPRQVDDQAERARALERAGAALCVEELGTDALQEACRKLLDPDTAARMSETAQAQVPRNGAERAAQAIADLLP